MPPTATAAAGLNIRAEMARQGVTQAALGQHLGLSQAAVSARLRGTTPFDINELCSIATLLNVSLGDLLRGVLAA